jgi:hypothetical protein
VFVSYARSRPSPRIAADVPAPGLLRQARALRSTLVDSLSPYFDGADVFLDADMDGGTLVQNSLTRAMCHSACVIALCPPVYFEHDWCGREWAGALALSRARLGDARTRESLIPCATKPFTERYYPINELKATQILVEDWSKLALWFDGPAEGVPQPVEVGRMAEQIINVMEELAERGVPPVPSGGTAFTLPAAPPLWQAPQLPFPDPPLFPLRAA